MKLFLFTPVLAAAALLAACSSAADEPQIEAPAGAITFRTDASRADDSRPAIEAFDVWATMHDTEGVVELSTIFNATTVSYDSDAKAWTYSGGDRYWFHGLAYNFRALYPSGLSGVSFNAANGENSALTVSEIVPAATPSFMAATDRREVALQATTQPAVQLTFHQLLSRISFRGSSNEQQLGADRRVILEYAAVYGIADRGSWSSEGFNPDDGNLGTWTPSSPAGSADQPLFKVVYPDGLELSPEGTDIFSGGDAIIAVPQTLSSAARLEIRFHYNVESAQSFTYSAPLADQAVVNQWLPGKSYRYPFSVNTNIFFSTPTVNPWNEITIDGQKEFLIK